MKIPHPELVHATSFEHAESLQDEVRKLVRIQPLDRQPHRVVGCDVAYSADGEWGFGAAVALDVETLIDIEHPTRKFPISFPYVPGLFAFRELPVLLEALKQLTRTPDVIIVEGHGIAHTRRAGLASHLGVVLETPTIGCAKSPLGGEWKEPGNARGSWTEIRMDGDRVGAAYRSRQGSRPVFISPGHLIDLPSSIELVSRVLGNHRLPEPLTRAHAAAVRERGRRLRSHQPV